jgi:ubiquinone/menaquinone biosynthesis C-methylase UbiE
MMAIAQVYMNEAVKFNRPMTKISQLIFARVDDASSLANWDRLASIDPIHAAIAKADERSEERVSSAAIETILRECPAGTVLDLGCGYGRLAKYLLPRRTYGHYVGLDDSAEMLKLFEQRRLARTEEGATPVTLVKGKIGDLPFPDASFDHVVISDVWLHNPKSVARASIEEVRRVLKPGGKILSFSNFMNAGNPAVWQETFYSRIILPLLGRSDANGPVRTYARSEVASLFRDFGAVRILAPRRRFVPIHLLCLPLTLNLWTWKQLAVRINRWLDSRLGPERGAMFSLYHDVIAIK